MKHFIMRNEILNILKDAQKPYNYQKKLLLLESLYKSVDNEKFYNCLVSITQSILQENNKSDAVKNILEFIAKFIVLISTVDNKQSESDSDDDGIACNDFFTNFVLEVLKYHNVNIQECRYNVCRLVSFILQNLSVNVHLDGDLCDTIQVAMLQNIQDSHPTIRIQAILALVRLQDPLNSSCPVVQAFMIRLNDPNHLVRKEATKSIAANALTIPKIVKKTVDVDPFVRREAYTSCGNLGVKCFRIIHRHYILLNGFNESNPVVKKTFLEYMLSKWITSLNGDYLAFFTTVRLDADERDIANTEKLCKYLMERFFKMEPIDQLIKVLPLDMDKVIPLEKLKIELAQYWNYLVLCLKKNEDTDEILDRILPDLTVLCNYIQKIINQKNFKRTENEHLDFQYILYNIINIVETYELAEEAGRKALDSLLKNILQNYRLEPRLLEKIIKLESDISLNSNTFTNDMCEIMSNLRVPFQTEQINPANNKAIDFEIARYKVRINTIEDDLAAAVAQQDYQTASILKNEITKYEGQIEELNKQLQVHVECPKMPEAEIIYWCLEILALTIKYCKIESISAGTLTPSLLTCRNEFLTPLLTETDNEIKWRVLKCVALFSIFDREYALQFYKLLCLPIVSYRIDPNYSKQMLIISITRFSDLIRVYGPELFCFDDTTIQSTGNSSHHTTNAKRKLYFDDNNEQETINDNMTLKIIIHGILDMLDDEADDLRDAALTVIAKLVLNSIYVNPWIIAKLILHWYSPITENRFQQKLGLIIKAFAENIDNSMEILMEAMTTVVDIIVKAPKTSPLCDIDLDSVIKFFTGLYDMKENIVESPFRKLAGWIIHTVTSGNVETSIHQLTRLLHNIDVTTFSLTSMKELLARAELLADKDLDRFSKMYIQKFIVKLRNAIQKFESSTSNVHPINGAERANKVIQTNQETRSKAQNSVETNMGSLQIETNTKEIDKTTSETDLNQLNSMNNVASQKEISNSVMTNNSPSSDLSTDNSDSSVVSATPTTSKSSNGSTADNEDVIPVTQETSTQKKRKIPVLESLCRRSKRTRRKDDECITNTKKDNEKNEILAEELSIRIETSVNNILSNHPRNLYIKLNQLKPDVMRQALESRRISINLFESNDNHQHNHNMATNKGKSKSTRNLNKNRDTSSSSPNSNRSNASLYSTTESSEIYINSLSESTPSSSSNSSGRYNLRKNRNSSFPAEQLNYGSMKKRRL